MKFTLKKACKECPFRKSNPGFLGKERAKEIADGIFSGHSFTCHKTNSFDSRGDTIETWESQHCLGATILLLNNNHVNKALRLAEVFGWIDLNKVNKDKDIFENKQQFIDHHS